MKEGFYFYRNRVYYGCYDETQTNGEGEITIIKPEHMQTDHSAWAVRFRAEYIQTDRPIREGDCAARLWENHRLLEPEYKDLEAMLSKMKTVVNLNTEQKVDFSEVEKRLGIALPKELKLIYTAICNQEEYFAGAEHFLPLDEIYIEQGIVVFFKKKRTPVAGYDTESGCLARCHKKEWSIEQTDYCCYRFCISRILTLAMENKPVFKKGRGKGKFVTTLNIERELEQFCNEKYHLLSEFNGYGIAVMYSDEKLLAWIRSNGFYADIHAGAVDEEHLNAFAEHLGQIAWKN